MREEVSREPRARPDVSLAPPIGALRAPSWRYNVPFLCTSWKYRDHLALLGKLRMHLRPLQKYRLHLLWEYRARMLGNLM